MASAPEYRRGWRHRPRFSAAATALAVSLAGSFWLHEATLTPAPTTKLFLERGCFLFTAVYVLLEIAHGLAKWRHGPRDAAGEPSGAAEEPFAPRPPVPFTRWHAGGCVLLAALVVAQTLLHLDFSAAYLRMTLPGFPVGAGVGAEGYLAWLEQHPIYEESWQFVRQAALYTGSEAELTTGDHDARAAYAYQAALLARPLRYFAAFVLLNVLWWYAAALAVWYLAARFLGAPLPAFTAALLTATGQGFVFMSSTPMSYVAGYAWGALLLALAVRWQLFGRQSSRTRWLLWGWLCGVSGLFYFTHVVLLGTAWVFGARRVPPLRLLLASIAALAVPASWYLVGHYLVGLRFQSTTAGDLGGEMRRLAQIAIQTPVLLPSEAGEHSLRTLIGGFTLPVLALAFVGTLAAAPRRRQWYLAVLLCGVTPALVLHMIPVTQRYGYLAYPAVYIAAAEGAWWLLAQAQALVARMAPTARLQPPGTAAHSPGAHPVNGCGLPLAQVALLVVLGLVHLFEANADLWGIYRFALAFGGP